MFAKSQANSQANRAIANRERDKRADGRTKITDAQTATKSPTKKIHVNAATRQTRRANAKANPKANPKAKAKAKAAKAKANDDDETDDQDEDDDEADDDADDEADDEEADDEEEEEGKGKAKAKAKAKAGEEEDEDDTDDEEEYAVDDGDDADYKILSLQVNVQGDIIGEIDNYKYNENTNTSSTFSNIYIPTKLDVQKHTKFEKSIISTDNKDYKLIFTDLSLLQKFLKEKNIYANQFVNLTAFNAFLIKYPLSFYKLYMIVPYDLIICDNKEEKFLILRDELLENTKLDKKLLNAVKNIDDFKELLKDKEFFKDFIKFIDKIDKTDKTNKISVFDNEFLLYNFLKKYPRYKLRFLKLSPKIVEEKYDLLKRNAEYLIKQFFKKDDKFYIKCNLFIIKTIVRSDCDIYGKMKKILTGYTKKQLITALTDKMKKDAREHRTRLLQSLGLELKNKNLIDNFGYKITQSDVNNIGGKPLTGDKRGYNNSLDTVVNIPFNEKYSADSKKLENPDELKKLALDFIRRLYLTDKIKFYKKYHIEYKYYKNRGIILETAKEYKKYFYCSILLTLKKKQLYNLSDYNCNSNKEQLLANWGKFCDENKKQLDKSNKQSNFTKLLCNDTSYDIHIKDMRDTVETIKDKCSYVKGGGKKTRNMKTRNMKPRKMKTRKMKTRNMKPRKMKTRNTN